MSMSDPIANFLTLIRNASRAKKKSVDCPSSKMKEQIARILKQEGYIENLKKIEDKKQGLLRIYLKYGQGRQKPPAITKLNRISRCNQKRHAVADAVFCYLLAQPHYKSRAAAQR